MRPARAPRRRRRAPIAARDATRPTASPSPWTLRRPKRRSTARALRAVARDRLGRAARAAHDQGGVNQLVLLAASLRLGGFDQAIHGTLPEMEGVDMDRG